MSYSIIILGRVARSWLQAINMPMLKKPRTPCLNCGKEAERWNKRFCSNRCQVDYQYRSYIQSWKRGEESGAIEGEALSRHLRRYLLEQHGERCMQCGWNQRHLITRQVPLTVHHIDGNSRNNREENLLLLCPNCHSLTDNYQNLNRGNGRTYRRKYEPRKNG